MGKDLCVEGVLHSLRALEQVEKQEAGPNLNAAVLGKR